ncbi:Protein WAVE-DAMPENED 2 [Capsicum baccatum]|uniref:Protein WAVE-DAMPENED 2 n=1 Tax=Capsicum baccatum TaxID=33114 RepID=A0A2G2VL33_CAPBA|nr:Protein WAVE-DAMPENED 2 [Capsicum baccatum]
MKLEEKVRAKEEETRQLQARKQEKKEAEIKQLRRNLNFKATPMPAFYHEPGRRSEEKKDGQSWEKAGARAAVRGRWRMDQKREILDVLRAKPVIFCVETRSNTPMPAFYREPGRRSEENKDGQSWEEAGAGAAVRGRWRMDRKREILDVLRAKPVIFCVETR